MTTPTGSTDRSAASIVLVRRVPTAEDRAMLRRLAEDSDRPIVLFFQGEGVAGIADTSLPDGAGRPIEAWACSGSWQRRHGDEPPEPVRLASLAEWLDRLLPGSRSGPELVCLGRATDPSPEPAASRRAGHGSDLLFLVAHAPVDDLDRLETLEPVLAAAALDFEVDVLFAGPGQAHLQGPGAQRWKQLTDFELGRLWAVQPGGSRASAVRPSADWPERAEGSTARAAASVEVEHLRRGARKIVVL